MKKYLEFHDNKSHKFWEVQTDGVSHTVRYGKVGTDGQSKTKDFDSPEKAEKDAEKLAASKMKKGYAEMSVKSERTRSKRFSLSYDESEDGKSLVPRIEKFAAKPEAAELDSITIGSWGDAFEGGPDEVVDCLAANADKFPKLRSLFIGDMDYETCEISWIIQTDLSPLLQAFPLLESFKIRGSQGLELSNMDHKSLRFLTIECGGLGKKVLASIAGGTLPSLERLELYLGIDDYGFDGSIKDIQPFMEKGRFPKLSYLGLRDSIIADEIAAAIAEASILDQVEELDLSLGALGDAGAKALLESSKIRNLKKLDLHYNFMSGGMVEKIKKLDVSIDASDRQAEEEYDGETYRYVSVSE
ncbi:MAG: WGR domain-containing protein [bacterium]|nr:WGR domain-containing protein [bacterium]